MEIKIITMAPMFALVICIANCNVFTVHWAIEVYYMQNGGDMMGNMSMGNKMNKVILVENKLDSA